jgi:hypothetical protein
MLKNNRWKLKHALVLAIASAISVNAYSLPDNLEERIIAAADKAVADAAARPVEVIPVLSPQAIAAGITTVTMPSGEDLRNIYLKSSYAMAVVLSDKEFEKLDKLNLPIAPKDSKGNYYLQLGSPNKAVNLPTGGVNIPVNLEALYYRSKLAEMDKAEKKASLASGQLLAKSISDPVYHVDITHVTSAYYFPVFEDLTPAQTTATWDHGGAWVGAVAVTWGTPSSYAITICGAQTITYETGIYSVNGTPVGYWSGNYAYGCQAGQITATATGAWGTYSDSVNFN